MSTDALHAMAVRLANAAVLDDIRSEGVKSVLGGWVWYDLRHWTDPREHAPENVDRARLAIDYAVQAGLAMRHPTQPHLLHT